MHPLDRVCVILKGKMDKREERYHKRDGDETGGHVNDGKTGGQRGRQKGLVREERKLGRQRGRRR